MPDHETTFLSPKKRKRLGALVVAAWFILFSVNSLCTAIIGGLAGKYWTMIDPQDRFIIAVAIIAQWTGVIQAFLFNTAKHLAKGEDPLTDAPAATKPPG